MQFWDSFFLFHCNTLLTLQKSLLHLSFFVWLLFIFISFYFRWVSILEVLWKRDKRHQVLQKVHQEHLNDMILSHLTCDQKLDLKFLYNTRQWSVCLGGLPDGSLGKRALSGPVSDITIISQSQPVVRPWSPLDMCHCPMAYLISPTFLAYSKHNLEITRFFNIHF